MLERLNTLAKEKGLEFGVKITNTFPVDVTRDELPSEEMYMSGKSLCALSLSVAHRLSKAFDGELRISYSGGADYFNIDKIFRLGIWPITVATTLLKPGGYNRDIQIAQKLAKEAYTPFTGVDTEGLGALICAIKKDPHHVKPVKPLPSRKLEDKVPLLDCFTAPCMEGCPIHQDIPAYVKLTGEGRYEEALEVILEKKQPLTKLAAEVEIYPQVLKNVKVKDKLAAQEDPEVKAQVARVSESLGESGRILLRQSGTEPVVRVMVEAASRDICETYVDQVIEVMKDRGHLL